MNLSPCTQLAWQLGATEAAGAHAPEIEPEHSLAALTKLRQFCSGEAAGALAAQGVDVSIHRPELELVADLLEEAAIEPGAFRHRLRERLGKGKHAHGKGETIHRSARSRQLFERATALAQEMKSETVRCGHLSLALLEERDSAGGRMLQEKGADLKALARTTHERLEKEPVRSLAGLAKADGPAETSPGTPFLDRFVKVKWSVR